MSLRTLLKRDIQHRRQVIAESTDLINHWKHQLTALSTPLPRQGVDYAYGTPDLGRLKAAGNTFICRYLGGDPSKDLTRDEALHLSNAGFDLIVVFEAAALGALGGIDAGYEDARDASRMMNAAIGAPHAPIYFACDWEVDPGQMPAVRAYFQGARKWLGRDRIGVYGGYSVVHELMSLDSVKYGWQTLAWSDGRWSPHAQLRQVAIEQHEFGIVCDLDRAIAADFGQFRTQGR
jgi:hypothetical protein